MHFPLMMIVGWLWLVFALAAFGWWLYGYLKNVGRPTPKELVIAVLVMAVLIALTSTGLGMGAWGWPMHYFAPGGMFYMHGPYSMMGAPLYMFGLNLVVGVIAVALAVGAVYLIARKK